MDKHCEGNGGDPVYPAEYRLLSEKLSDLRDHVIPLETMMMRCVLLLMANLVAVTSQLFT